MAARTSRRVRWAVAALVFASLAGIVMLKMKAETSSPALRQPSPSTPDAAPLAGSAATAAPSAIQQPSAPAHDRDAAPPAEAALLREIEDSVRLGRVGHARSLADRFYRAFPESPEIARIERLTGYHPRPYGPRR